MAGKAHFDRELFGFLRSLARNNDREWFAKNKGRFEDRVKDPVLAFVVDFGKPLGKISPHFRADPRPVGGSMFRIHRDTRFSKDKSPYKTHVGIQFRHEAGKDAHAPCFYVHLEPGEGFVGAGIWHPDTKALGKIRDAIVGDPAGWKRASRAKAFRDTFELAGDSLKRPPRGYDPEHPHVDDLRRKDFIGVAHFTEKDACSPRFLGEVAARCRASRPFVRFLCEALDVPF